jgi:hypothetical protein
MIISPLKKVCPFIWANWNSLLPRMTWSGFIWFGQLVLAKIFLEVHIYCSAITTLGESGDIYLNKSKSQSRNDNFC